VPAALLFWFGDGEAWQPLAIGSAVVSTVGIVLFFGTWPVFNTVAALGVNAVALIALLVLHWTPPPGRCQPDPAPVVSVGMAQSTE
jgi:hypothetical protein